MKLLSRTRVLMAAALIAATTAFFPAAASAGMKKEVLTLTVKASQTTSERVPFAVAGTVRFAALVTPSDDTTATLSSYNGPTIGHIALASEQADTGTTTLTEFAGVPVSGECNVQITAATSTGSARTYRVVMFIETTN
ncbi:MAG TPA: hypothetical protein VK181_05515 [Rhizobium sp.]|nr:hypothetical protein [Rhizobium sp.]